MTQFEKDYIENWVVDYGYDMDVIEIALKRTTLKQNPTFEYVNTIITDWHERKLKTPDEINAFLAERKQKNKNINDLKKGTSKASKANFEQRNYDNLDFLYANNDLEEN